jgi:predicted dinucleotide-binding enzyme
MKIGIIGAGNVGATLARKLIASGHHVKLGNSRGPDTIREEDRSEKKKPRANGLLCYKSGMRRFFPLRSLTC